MSNGDFKKERELETLSYFNQVYEEATGDYLEVVKSCERPDFICKRNDGTVVGVELVRILRGHPNDRFADQILNKNYYMEPGQAIDLIQIFSSIKEEKRQSKGWRHSEKTILIMELIESPLSELSQLLSEELFPDIADSGFLEVWLADLSEIEAYGNIELFCLHPREWWGYYKRPLQKPYS